MDSTQNEALLFAIVHHLYYHLLRIRRISAPLHRIAGEVHTNYTIGSSMTSLPLLQEQMYGKVCENNRKAFHSTYSNSSDILSLVLLQKEIVYRCLCLD